MGKTTLVRSLLASPALARRRHLVGHCQDLPCPYPFGPVVEALTGTGPVAAVAIAAGAIGPPEVVGARLAVLAALLPELGACLPAHIPTLLEAGAERHRLIMALSELLELLAPAVLVLEDLHWADRGTLELLAWMVPRLPSRLAIVATYRRPGIADHSSVLGLASRSRPGAAMVHVSLRPFSVEEVQEMATGLLGAPVTASFAARLHERTGGLAFAVEEVVRLLQDRGQLVPAGGEWAPRYLDALEVPPGVQDSVLGRIALLGPGAQQVVRAASVVTDPADEWILGRISGLPPARLRQALGEALRAGLVIEAGDARYAPRHDLARQAVCADIPGPERRQLHLRAALALGDKALPADLPRLAHHFKQGGRPLASARCAEAAADGCRGDHARAAGLLLEALAGPGIPTATRVRLSLKLGRAALADGAPSTAQVALPVLEEIASSAPLTVGTRGELRLYLGGLLHHAGNPWRGRQEIERAAGELRRRPHLAAHALVNLGLPFWTEGDVATHLAWLDKAVDAAGRQQDLSVGATVTALVAAVMIDVGDPAGWDRLADLPPDMTSPALRQAMVRGNLHLASAACRVGYYERAEHLISEVHRARSELGHTAGQAGTDSIETCLQWLGGRWEGLEAKVARTVAEGGHESCMHRLVLGRLLTSRERLAEAVWHLSTAYEAARSSGRVTEIAAAAGALGRALAERGDVEGALAVVGQGAGILRQKGIWTWSTELALTATDVLVLAQRPDEASSLVQEVATGIQGLDAPSARAALVSCQAALARAGGRLTVAAAEFRLAEVAWAGLGRPYDAAMARERAGLALLAASHGEGRDHLIAALEVYGRLGATGDAARVKRALRAHGLAVPYPWRGGRRGYGDRLSPRESEVARLASSGMSNREIAQTLFLSPRTAEGHLARAMGKLGVRSRGALVAPMVSQAEARKTKNPYPSDQERVVLKGAGLKDPDQAGDPLEPLDSPGRR